MSLKALAVGDWRGRFRLPRNNRRSRLGLQDKPQSLARVRPFLLDISVNPLGPLGASGEAQVVKGLKFNKLKAREHILQQIVSVKAVLCMNVHDLLSTLSRIRFDSLILPDFKSP